MRMTSPSEGGVAVAGGIAESMRILPTSRNGQPVTDRQVARSSASLNGMEADPRIVLHRPGGTDDLVDHPAQPADYLHTDGTLWTWRERWRPTGGVLDERGRRRGGTLLRVYDPVIPRPGFTLTRAVGPHPKQRRARRYPGRLACLGKSRTRVADAESASLLGRRIRLSATTATRGPGKGHSRSNALRVP